MTIKQFLKQNGLSGRFRLNSFGVSWEDGYVDKLIINNEIEFTLKEKEPLNSVFIYFFSGDHFEVTFSEKSKKKDYEIYLSNPHGLTFLEITKK